MRVDDVVITMVEAGPGVHVHERIAEGAPAPQESTVAEGLEAAKPFIKTLCEAQAGLAERVGKKTKEFPLFPAYADEIYDAVARKAEKRLGKLLTIAAKQERSEEHTSELQSRGQPVCRLLHEKKKPTNDEVAATVLLH